MAFPLLAILAAIAKGAGAAMKGIGAAAKGAGAAAQAAGPAVAKAAQGAAQAAPAAGQAAAKVAQGATMAGAGGAATGAAQTAANIGAAAGAQAGATAGAQAGALSQVVPSAVPAAKAGTALSQVAPYAAVSAQGGGLASVAPQMTAPNLGVAGRGPLAQLPIQSAATLGNPPAQAAPPTTSGVPSKPLAYNIDTGAPAWSGNVPSARAIPETLGHGMPVTQAQPPTVSSASPQPGGWGKAIQNIGDGAWNLINMFYPGLQRNVTATQLLQQAPQAAKMAQAAQLVNLAPVGSQAANAGSAALWQKFLDPEMLKAIASMQGGGGGGGGGTRRPTVAEQVDALSGYKPGQQITAESFASPVTQQNAERNRILTARELTGLANEAYEKEDSQRRNDALDLAGRLLGVPQNTSVFGGGTGTTTVSEPNAVSVAQPSGARPNLWSDALNVAQMASPNLRGAVGLGKGLYRMFASPKAPVTPANIGQVEQNMATTRSAQAATDRAARGTTLNTSGMSPRVKDAIRSLSASDRRAAMEALARGYDEELVLNSLNASMGGYE